MIYLKNFYRKAHPRRTDDRERWYNYLRNLALSTISKKRVWHRRKNGPLAHYRALHCKFIIFKFLLLVVYHTVYCTKYTDFIFFTTQGPLNSHEKCTTPIHYWQLLTLMHFVLHYDIYHSILLFVVYWWNFRIFIVEFYTWFVLLVLFL